MTHPQQRYNHRVFLLGFLGVVGVGVSEAWAEKPGPDPAAGKAAYLQSCARCHGVTGAGDGIDAKKLYPKPRVLAEGVYKFRTTASGTSPTDDDLFATLTNGLPGSGMPDWKHLDESLRWQLVYYVKSLAPALATTPPQPVLLGNDPGPKGADLTKGQQVYQKLGCAACHGAEGRGDGTSAKTLTDNWNHPIRPANLTQGWNYRGGSDPNAIVTRMMTGIDGTPMPSYAEAASTEDMWQLAYYVRSLQREPSWSMIVHAAHVEGDLPMSPSDARWETVEHADVRMCNAFQPGAGDITGALSISVVSVQAVYNKETLGLRMVWIDPTEDRQPADNDTPIAGPNVGDALAIVLKPHAVAGDVLTLHTWPMVDSPPLDLVAWSAKRQQAAEAIVPQYDGLLNGTIAGAARASQAVYEHGQWALVITRPLRAADLDGAAQTAVGQVLPIACAAWDGGNPGQRAVSTWIDVFLGTSSPEKETKAAAQAAHQARAQIGIVAGIALLVGCVLLIKKP